MKAAWHAVSFLAVVHLLTLALCGGWLWRTNRLDGSRIQQVRELFARTIDEEQAAAQAALDAAASEEVLATDRPGGSADQLGILTALQQQERQTARRLQDETDMLSRQFEAMNRQTEAERAEFEAERLSWREAIQAEWKRKNDEQFAQTVRQYESLPARQGKQMLMVLVDQGRRDRAVAYLDAMAPRALTKILKEFKLPDETILATELLEDLTRFDLGVIDPQDFLDEQSPDNAE